MARPLYTFLGAVPQCTFSPYLHQFQSCVDADDRQALLLRAFESEPYLLAKAVSLANSVVYGVAGRYFYTPADCLSRIGQTQAGNVAMAFFVEAGLRGWIRNQPRSQAVWQEAVFAAQVAQMLSSFVQEPIPNGIPFLTTLLSYLGELFLVGPVFDELGPNPTLALYARGQLNELDAYVLTRLLLPKLDLPSPIRRVLHHTGLTPELPDEGESGAVALLLLARSMAQAFYPEDAFVARIEEPLAEWAPQALGLAEASLAEAARQARQLRQKLPHFLT